MSQGVYFLANDTVLDQTLGFLNSFRTYNPDIPLCLVPFADDDTQIRSHAQRYRFTVWSDDAVLRRCDEISQAFHDGATAGQYRKLAMWTGDFDEFIYIDTDTIVLEPVDFAFHHLGRYDFLTSHSNYPHLRQWVWRDSIETTGALTAEQIAFAANTGFIVSRAGLLDPAKVAADLAAPLALASHMTLLCAEQPLLNYLIVTSGRPYSSLSLVAAQTGDPDIPLEQWAGGDIGRVEEGRLVPLDCRRVLLVHWAGEWQRVRSEGGTVPYHELWQHYRAMGDRPLVGG
ncbi:MAG: hypothetical protein V7603_1446 [Micromonosporaceae bacterium]